MSMAERQPTGFEVVIGEDGSIGAEELRRLGFQPGAHLRIFEEPSPAPRKKLRGILKDVISPEAVEEITEELRRNKEERIAAIMREGR
jgi:hypothetical protein